MVSFTLPQPYDYDVPMDFVQDRQEAEMLLEPVEEEITTALGNFKENWWKIHNDEDESDSKELKEAAKRMPLGWKQRAVLAATIFSNLGLMVLFRDEPIMKGTTGASINAVKISYTQVRPGTREKYVMRAIAVATLIAGITLRYVPEDQYGVIRIMRTAPLTDLFMTIVLKCDINSAGLDKLLNKAIKKCTNSELPAPVAKAITKGTLATLGGVLMNIPQYTGPFIASGAAVLAKANMRGVVDTVFQRIEAVESGIKQKALLALVLGTCTAFAGASAYALTDQVVRQSSFSWLPAALLVINADTIARVVKNAIKTCEIPKEYKKKIEKEIKQGIRDPEPPKPWWKKCLTVVNGAVLVGATLGIAYVVGPATLPSSAGASVANNSGIITTVCQEMSSLLKIAAGKLLPSSVALFGSLGLLAGGAGYHLFETFSGMTSLLSPVQRATGAAFLAADMGVAGYELKDHLRGETNPDYQKKKKPKAQVSDPIPMQVIREEV